MPRLGAHLSTAGGVSRAALAATRLGSDALQVFLRSPGRWAVAPLPPAELERFRAAAAPLAGACFAHAPYLLNLASADEVLWRRSLATLVEELQRAGALGLAGVVLHPGSAGTQPREDAQARCRDAIAAAIEQAGDAGARLILEGTAGMRGQLGTGPAELARLVPGPLAGRVGICLDTAHLWAAGRDLLGGGWDEVLAELADHWPSPAPDLIHGNDTPVALGARRDRHAPPGDGRLGEAFFRRLLADPRLADRAVIVEMPPGEDNADVARVLERLRAWSG